MRMNAQMTSTINEYDKGESRLKGSGGPRKFVRDLHVFCGGSEGRRTWSAKKGYFHDYCEAIWAVHKILRKVGKGKMRVWPGKGQEKRAGRELAPRLIRRKEALSGIGGRQGMQIFKTGLTNQEGIKEGTAAKGKSGGKIPK